MKKYNQPKKLRAVPLIRCSTFGQADTSITDQLKSIQAYAIEKNILLLKAHELPGVSGSIRTNIEKAVYAIIQRKESGEQIDAIIVYDLSRFTRSGPYHFGKLMTILEDAGIKLIEIVDDLGDSEMAPIFRVLKAEAAHRQAMSIADNCARGSRTSLEVGRRTYCSRQPYGIDRLYVNADERPLYIMRDLGHGIRIRMDPKSSEELHRYPKGMKFKKDKMDRVVLIPGAPERQAIVHRIFQEYFLQRRGGHLIAKSLNDQGIPSPDGGQWHSVQIRAMLRTPAYVGYGYANFRASGIFVMQQKSSPKKLKNNNGKILNQIRPMKEWYRVECERLVEYLPEDVRELTKAHQRKFFERYVNGHIPDPENNNKTKGNSDRNKKYLLSGILKERTTGYEMRGSTAKGGRYNYYRISNGQSKPTSSKNFLNRTLPVPPIDSFALAEIERLLCGVDDLRALLIDEIKNQDRDREGSQDEAHQLKKELSAVNRKVEMLLDQLGGEFADQAKEKIQKATLRKREIDDRMAEIDLGPRLSIEDIEKMTDLIIFDLRSMLNRLANDHDPALRQLCETLIDHATADLEKREVKFNFAIPASMLVQRDICPRDIQGSPCIQQTNKWRSIPISVVTLVLPRKCQGDCWNAFKPKGCSDCRRKRKAA